MIHISVQKLREICEQIEREVDDISGYESDVLAWVESKGGLEAVKKRLMPEGMEWPRFEDNEPVRLWEEFSPSRLDIPLTISEIQFVDGADFALSDIEGHLVTYRNGERVKRPAFKVLDADGVEIRVGDTVWNVSTGEKYTVGVFVGGCVNISNAAGGGLQLLPSQLTHRAPVLAADGKPLREGETVWGKGGGIYRVTSVHDGEVFARHVDGSFGAEVESAGGGGLYRLRADNLTHERPDSWERLEEDAKLGRCDYNKAHGYPACCIGCDGLPFSDSCSEIMARDLVRRAKALAERGQ